MSENFHMSLLQLIAIQSALQYFLDFNAILGVLRFVQLASLASAMRINRMASAHLTSTSRLLVTLLSIVNVVSVCE